jgi:hypothetical protein
MVSQITIRLLRIVPSSPGLTSMRRLESPGRRRANATMNQALIQALARNHLDTETKTWVAHVQSHEFTTNPYIVFSAIVNIGPRLSSRGEYADQLRSWTAHLGRYEQKEANRKTGRLRADVALHQAVIGFLVVPSA